MASAPSNDRAAKIAAARGPQRSNTRLILAAVVGLVVVAAVVLAVVLGRGDDTPPAATGTTGNSTGSSVALPKTVKDATSPVIANPSGTLKEGVPTLQIFEDFQCPACKQAEGIFGDKLTELAGAGKINMVVFTKTFMNDNLRNDSSTKVGNAALCAADAGVYGAYRQKVFARQPAEEGTAGYADSDVEAAATEAGLTGAKLDTWKQCVANRPYAPYLQGIERYTSETLKVTSTPGYYVNGVKMDLAGVATPQDFEKKLFETAK